MFSGMSVHGDAVAWKGEKYRMSIQVDLTGADSTVWQWLGQCSQGKKEVLASSLPQISSLHCLRFALTD